MRPQPFATLVSALALSLAATAALAAEDVSALLKRKTQEFSDAGKQGDAAVMARLLDARVIFFNETGEVATKKDMVEGATPPPKGVETTLTVTDWNCQQYGNVAVASFIDELTGTVRGRPVHFRFRSVETWLKTGAQWRMIGSETLTLPDANDPPAVILPAAALDDYVGSYAAGGTTITFTRQGADLMASANGGAAAVQKAAAADVLFTPGSAQVRKIFQRDATGKIVGFVYVTPTQDLVFRRA